MVPKQAESQRQESHKKTKPHNHNIYAEAHRVGPYEFVFENSVGLVSCGVLDPSDSYNFPPLLLQDSPTSLSLHLFRSVAGRSLSDCDYATFLSGLLPLCNVSSRAMGLQHRQVSSLEHNLKIEPLLTHIVWHL